MAHFFCAYVLLTRIFFRPALTAYYAEVATQRALHQAYEEALKNVSSYRESLARDRQSFFERLHAKVPVVDYVRRPFGADDMPFDCVVPRTDHNVESFARKIVDRIEAL